MTGFGFGADRFGWTDDALAEVRRLRGWTEQAIERLELRWDGERVGFPIRDATLDDYGVARYTPDPSKRNGRVKVEQPTGVPRQLFPPPETIGETDFLLIVEGEPDAVAATSCGFDAVAVPGTQGWKPEYVGRFSGRRQTVYVVFDCDEQGREAGQRVAASLADAGVDARLVDLDPSRDDGYDLTDYLLDRPDFDLVMLLDSTPPYLRAIEPPPDESPWRSQPWPLFRDESPEEHRWIIDGLLPAGSLTFVAGPPKKGKTWLGLGIALAVSTGLPLLGEYQAALQPVLYVALEGSRTGLRARIGALARGMGVDPDTGQLDSLHMLYRPRPFNLVDLSTAEWLLDEASRTDAGLIVVDVLRAAARFRENDAEDFARVRDGLEPLLAADRAVLLLHHFGKLTETQKERSPGERMAGTGAMYGALDVGLLITQSTDGARRLRVDVEARDFAAPDALGVVILGEGSGEHHGFTYLDTAQLALDATAAGARDYIAELLDLFDDEEWRTGDSLAKSLLVHRTTVEQAVLEEKERAEDLGEYPRVVRWDPERDGKAPGAKSKNAKPYGTAAMLANSRLEVRRDRRELTLELPQSLVPPYGGDDGDETLRKPAGGRDETDETPAGTDDG